MNKKLLLFISAFFTVVTVRAQSLDVHFNGFGFLDNREYKAFVERSRTYSGARTTLDLGLNADSLNHFRVGVNAIHEFGAQPYFLKVDPVAYYSYESHHWLFNAGMFPREGLLSQVPRAILNDTLRYYRPNVEGLLARYQSSHGYETMYLDWVSRQTNVEREQFLFGLAGKYAPKPYGSFYIAHYFNMLHDAGPAIDIPGDHIRDNGAGQVRLGYNVKHTKLDSLSFEAGGMISLARTRGANGADFFKKPLGFVFSAYAGWHRFAIFEEFYAGEPQFVTYGDSYYQKKFYNRIDLIYTPFLFNRIKGQFIASFHFSPGQFNDNQEAFRVTYDLGRKTLIRFKD
ncbi:hypothetical protein [Mucilaginibacter ginkgonis]|uniref:Uncharacterized protein n=1 Tax=Mucilaginibacter ginkgonis TaxID=2682091 RepID=A0A6I4HV95_9SPHI|nr:hypothetical protein [Mucilaginibacter ginkgonis]QQL49880.1 hypothetical protein GO620_000060 [Mucilaginibacter ginkgonis]